MSNRTETINRLLVRLTPQEQEQVKKLTSDYVHLIKQTPPAIGVLALMCAHDIVLESLGDWAAQNRKKKLN